jgi:hypothetical protein
LIAKDINRRRSLLDILKDMGRVEKTRVGFFWRFESLADKVDFSRGTT